MAIFVPLLWYAIGSRVDRRRIRQIYSRTVLMKGIMAVILVLLLIVAIVDVMTTRRRAVELLILQISVLFWLVFGIWAVLRWFGWQQTRTVITPPAASPE